MNSNGSKPKLELQVNVPSTIILLQDKPAMGESKFGKWWLYNVKDETGNELSFFAPEQVQIFIESNDLRKGSKLKITKISEKNGKMIYVNYKSEILSSSSELQSVDNVTNQNNAPHELDKQKNDIRIMRDCLESAITLQNELGSIVDVNRIALSLFINRGKSGSYGY